MFDRVYIEIGNICNMRCSFCAGTSREPRQMEVKEFQLICEKLRGYTDNILLHVMGEPLLHPELDKLLKIAGDFGYKVSITTNGTLLHKVGDVLISNADHIHRISISLHAPEGGGREEMLDAYLDRAIDFAGRFSSLDKNVVFRLWNLDTNDRSGQNSQNVKIYKRLKRAYTGDWIERYSGYRIAYRTFLELDGIFTWPKESTAPPKDQGRCYGLLRQIAILADGTVVPCCLDSDGQIPLGNILSEELGSILSSEMAIKIKRGFERGRMVHPVCQKCTYARRFS